MAERVLVIGGGIAGLTAALELSATHSVALLEARERWGGRIYTVRDDAGIPFELGAEFVHGKASETWRFIEAAGLRTHEVPDRHFHHSGGTLVEIEDFWDQLSAVTGEIEPKQKDASFAHFISRIRAPRESVQLAKQFVEGFHAAPLEKASIQATRLSEESSEEIDGQRQLRIHRGFEQLVQYVAEACRRRGVEMRAGVEVVSVDWRRRPVAIGVKQESSEISADRVIITLPIGVLRAGGIRFTPNPSKKLDAAHALDMGIVTKVSLHFRERFWPVPNFGFIHSDDEWFATWWSDERGNILTAWSGGPKGHELARNERDFVLNRAVEGASKLFGESLPAVRKLLRSAHLHNWKNDPFSRGAYSFVPVNGTGACRELARPEEDTLFFAGEATDLNYQFGTVHGAIASGMRAAADVKKASAS
jgi:monoamine oxidase